MAGGRWDRKMDADDVFDTVSATLGLNGGVDGIALLKRNSNSVTALHPLFLTVGLEFGPNRTRVGAIAAVLSCDPTLPWRQEAEMAAL
jgi:hypothetical protein